MTLSGPHLIRVSDDQIVVKRGVHELLVSGSEAADIAALVVERAGAAQVFDDLFDDIPEPTRTAANNLLSALQVRRLVDPGLSAASTSRSPESVAQDAFFRALDQDPGGIRERLQTLRLTVIGINPISQSVIRTVESMGMGQLRVFQHPELDVPMGGDDWTDGRHPSHIWSDDWRRSLERESTTEGLVLATGYPGAEGLLLDINRRAVLAGLSFLPVWLDGGGGFVGPLAIPRESGCLRCWLDQSGTTRPGAAQRYSTVIPPGPQSASAAGVAAGVCGPIAAMEIVKFATRCAPSGVIGRVVQVNPMTAEFTSRRVLKMPRCPHCSDIVDHHVPTVMAGPQIPDR